MYLGIHQNSHEIVKTKVRYGSNSDIFLARWFQSEAGKRSEIYTGIEISWYSCFQDFNMFSVKADIFHSVFLWSIR